MTRDAMRIILTVNYSPWGQYVGGGQRSTHLLATALSNAGHDVTVVYTKSPIERIAVPTVNYDIRFAAFPALAARNMSPLRPLTVFSVAYEVAKLVRQERPVVVHSQGEEGALLPELRKHVSFGLVATPRYPSYPKILHAGRTLSARALRVGIPIKYQQLGLLLRGADAVCPTSASSAAMVRRAYGVQSTVVPNGVDQEFISARRSATASHGPILFFGRLARSKGADLLLHAYSRLSPPRRKLLIVGEGELRRELESLASRSLNQNDVCFLGWQQPSTLARLLSEARLVVLPSREESFGNSMVETMAAGAPLITTDVGSLPEVVGDAAETVPCGDVAALTAAIERLLANHANAERLGAMGRERVRERYSWEATAARFVEIYQTLIR